MSGAVVRFNTLTELFAFAARTPTERPLADLSGRAELIAETVRNHDAGPGFFTKRRSGGEASFQETPFADLYHQAGRLGAALIELGVERGDRVGLFADNREEWLLSDMAVIRAGALDVPRGCDSTAEEIAYICEHSGSKVAFVEHAKMLAKSREALCAAGVHSVVLLEGDQGRSTDDALRVVPLSQLLSEPQARATAALAERSAQVSPEDSFTIIYTSGTTGRPKGVELTHANICYNVNEVPQMIGVGPGERCVSILPIWHVFERTLEYSLLPYGAKLYYSSPRELRSDLLVARPTFMASAPRLWENIYDGILAKLEGAEQLKRELFHTALRFNKRMHRSLSFLRGNELGRLPSDDPQRQFLEGMRSLRDFIPATVLDQLVFRKIRAALGGALRGTISGGGALPAHVDEFFNAIGIPVYEGYGMTECAPIISVRTRGRVVQGSVGFTPPGTDVRIVREDGTEAGRGEVGVIQVRGPQVMKGYYRDPEATAKVLVEGWLNTGDLGFVSANGTLSIRGRAKDTIVLLGGENVEPEPIESRLKESPFIDQVMVVGQDRKSLGALIYPNVSALEREGLLPKGANDPLRDINRNQAARSHFARIIKEQVNAESGFKGFERITGFALLERPFEVGRELTNLFKLRRNVIAEEYQELIESMYSRERAEVVVAK